jgi:hypothetical protein
MRRPLLERAKLVLPRYPALIWYIAMLLFAFLSLSWVESRLGQDLPIKSRVMNFLLFYAAVYHAVFRAFVFHPAFRSGYRSWLELTPWTYRKPLPLGPVELVWEDGLILGPLILVDQLLPESRAPQLLCTFLLVHLICVNLSFWPTGSRGFGFATAFGLGLAVWTWNEPIACLAVLAGTYALAYEGLRRALCRFPWARRSPIETVHGATWIEYLGFHRELCGWPHDRMMADIVRCPSVRRIDALLCTSLACWWFYALVSLVNDPDMRWGFSMAGFMAAMVFTMIIRLCIYIQGYSSPLRPWARIRTNRWIIPGFDRVFVAPICSLLVGLSVAVLLFACGVPGPARFTVAAGMTVLAALTTPPRLGEWRLTGAHRIAFTPEPVLTKSQRLIQCK